MLEETLDKDLKTAMLSGDRLVVGTLRGLKSTILYAKVAGGNARDQAMSDDKLVALLQKEAKKRQESADLYRQGGNTERAQTELTEKAIIEKYLPAQLSEEEITKIVDECMEEARASGQIAMGAIIGKVKQQTAGKADGALIARLVKVRLDQ